MKPQEQIAQLEKEKAELQQQVNGLTKRVKELEAAKPKSKSRQQAEQGLEMLKVGPVTREQFAKLNPKYPSDVAYYIKNILKIDLKTVRTENGSVYMLPEQFKAYTDGLAKEKAAADAAKAEVKAEAKEAVRQAPAQVSPAVAAGHAKTGARAAVLA